MLVIKKKCANKYDDRHILQHNKINILRNFRNIKFIYIFPRPCH